LLVPAIIATVIQLSYFCVCL